MGSNLKGATERVSRAKTILRTLKMVVHNQATTEELEGVVLALDHVIDELDEAFMQLWDLSQPFAPEPEES